MMVKKKIAVLGASGFIGSHIFDCLIKDYDTTKYDRSTLNFNNPETFKHFTVDHVTIIDCITQIDKKQEIMQTNYFGLSEFINYLKIEGRDFNYVYFSSLSTLEDHLRETSIYVKSKYLAEVLLEDRVPDYKIVRLTYPFGKGENENRLLPRLARNILNGEKLEVNNCPIHLTPIDFLKGDFVKLVLDDQRVVNYIVTPSITLRQVCELMAKEFGKPLDIFETECTAPSLTKSVMRSYSYDQLIYSLTSHINIYKEKTFTAH